MHIKVVIANTVLAVWVLESQHQEGVDGVQPQGEEEEPKFEETKHGIL